MGRHALARAALAAATLLGVACAGGTRAAPPTVGTATNSAPTLIASASPASTPAAAPTGLPDIGPVEEVLLGVPVTLAPLERVRIDGVVWRFDGVINDSRCPIDVTCVWLGEATVALMLTTSAGSNVGLTLVVPMPAAAPAGPHEVRVLALEPQAHAGTPIEAGAYRVTLRVERIAR